MPGTRYSKQTVLDFLSAKLDGIDDTITAKRADYDAAHLDHSDRMAEFLQEYENRIDHVQVAAVDFRTARMHDDPVEVREATLELYRRIQGVSREIPNVKLDRNLWGYYPDIEVKRLNATAEADRAEIRRKIALLTEAEGESFSVTDLEKLGLLKYIR